MASAGPKSTQYLIEQARRVASASLGLLFPPRCVVCGRVGALLCTECIAAFASIPKPCCPVCGEPQIHTGLCPKCREQRRAFDSIQSAFLFTGGIRKAIHAFKYQRQRDLAQPLVSAMMRVLPDPHRENILVCSVPLHPRREKERGYNQATLLAGELARAWGLPLAASDTLQRTRETESQVGLDFPTRQANVGDAFWGNQAVVGGRSILLVDDVCTTGATLHACAVALREAGAVHIQAVTLARAT